MKLNIKGTRRPVDAAWQDETLLFILREHFGLVGAKIGCGLGQCGACTVIIDGEARRSCLERTGDLAASRIATVEGLGTPDAPPLSQICRIWSTMETMISAPQTNMLEYQWLGP